MQPNAGHATVVQIKMNPDKLFDYLDGKLSPNERAKLEERFMSEPELRQELAIARQIHAQMGDSREIVGFAQPTLEDRGAVLGRRIMIAFAILVFANVLFGIYAIAVRALSASLGQTRGNLLSFRGKSRNLLLFQKSEKERCLDLTRHDRIEIRST